MIWFRSSLQRSAGSGRSRVRRDARRRFAAQQVIDVLHDLVHVDERLVRRRAGPEHRVDQRREPVGFGDDHARVFVQRGSLSSRSSSCAAPRSPPSGFLISCASCRTIARLLSSCVMRSFSRVMR